MTRFLALVVEDAQTGPSTVKSILRMNQFDVLDAADAGSAQGLLELHCPHLVFVELDAKGANLAWVESVKRGKFAFLAVAVAGSPTGVDELKRCAQARVADYVTKPYQPQVLERKLGLICHKIRALPPYQVLPTPERKLEAWMTTQCMITAISETGIQVGGALAALTPVERIRFVTALFQEIGVKSPTLKLTNTGRVENSRGQTELINFIQVQGWEESDRKLIRHSIKNNRLEAIS
jgi:DNA-binding response OmpR family regulator